MRSQIIGQIIGAIIGTAGGLIALLFHYTKDTAMIVALVAYAIMTILGNQYDTRNDIIKRMRRDKNDTL